MFNTEKMLYGLDDVCIIPATQSFINSRSQCSITFESTDILPIFVAPMSCLVDYQTYPAITRLRVLDLQKENKQPVCARINAILPRSEKLEDRLKTMASGEWVAFSLQEADQIAEGKLDFRLSIDCKRYCICIDMANGHMYQISKVCKKLKDFFMQKGLTVEIMVGNIANPDTYRCFCEEDFVDYVRLGIGSGNVCTTSVQTGVHYPMASLIAECHSIRRSSKNGQQAPKIVADGGFQRIDQCVKALALGADYIMLGQIIAKSDEACGKEFRKVHYGLNEPAQFLPREEADELKRQMVLEKSMGSIATFSTMTSLPNLIEEPVFREYYGMSTLKAQKEFNPDAKDLKHSEGLETYVTIDYPLTEWLSDFAHALRSAMSYTSCMSLEEFTWNAKCGLMSRTDFNSYMYRKI